jgi:hypothetical protein
MTLLRLVSLVVLASASVAACGGAPASAPPPSAAAPPAASVDAPHTASAPVASAPAAAPAAPPAAPAAAEAAPPCIDGEIVMGTCLCPKGKGADSTGHCVFMPCPSSETGGTVFRDESGQCMECRPGTKPVGNGKCSS